MNSRKRVLSGIQPSGAIHIGNYIGAVKRWASSQDEFENFFCIVNLHAITLPQDPETLRKNTRELAAVLFACGIDPERSALFVQSHVAAHSGLAWIMNCMASMGHMERMTQYKEKSEKLKQQASVGLFTYPALMAADILLYEADYVPVGADQKQHVELTRDLAQRFNHRFGDTFKIPEPMIPKSGARIMSLKDPLRKMSKSDEDEMHSIGVLDPPDLIMKKFKAATTDSGKEIVFDPDKAGVFNLLTIYKGFSEQSEEEIEKHFNGKGYGHLKIELAELVIEKLKPIQDRFNELNSDPDQLDQLLLQGKQQAEPIADKVLQLAQEKMGLG